MQLSIGSSFAGIALTIPVSTFFQYSLAFFWLMAFSSATHDIAADGFYMIALSDHDQSFFVGIRSTFYRVAMITGQGLLVIFAGYLEVKTGNIQFAWTIALSVLGAIFVIFFLYHNMILSRPTEDTDRKSDDYKLRLLQYFVFLILISVILPFYILVLFLAPLTKFDPRFLLWKIPFSNSSFARPILLFMTKDKLIRILLFLLFYRLGEAQLTKVAPLFLLDSKSVGGVGLITEQVGFVYGTIGTISLVIGGILGGILAAQKGLKYWIWWMVIAINLPDLVYVYLSYTQTSNLILINICVAIEQFGYGFGFTAFLLFLIFISKGEHKTSHYAIATGVMALGMMIPGMFSGWIQETVGYQHFFLWVCLCTIPVFVLTKFIPIDPEFGIKRNEP